MAPPTPSYPELSYPELPDPSHLDPGHADPSHADPSHLDPSHPEPGLSYRGGKLSRISLLREIEETTDLKNINITDIDYPQFLLQCMRNSQPFYERIFDTIADLEAN